MGIIQNCLDISNFHAARKTDANKQQKKPKVQATGIFELEEGVVEWNKNILDWIQQNKQDNDLHLIVTRRALKRKI